MQSIAKGNCSDKSNMNNSRCLGEMNLMPDVPNLEVLSLRERQVALLTAKGLANKANARELNVTEGTIKLHLHSAYQKLGIKSRFALSAWVAKLASKRAAGR
jgi:DNA-binding NarL/FixJ family response regulator